MANEKFMNETKKRILSYAREQSADSPKREMSTYGWR